MPRARSNIDSARFAKKRRRHWPDPIGLDPHQGDAANASMLIYKILRPAEWAHLQEAGETRGAPVDLQDGYVHFSTAVQVADTLARHFARDGDLTLLACDADALASNLRWEPSRGGALFPHLYRPLRLADVIWARPVPGTNGVHDPGKLQ
jgi:uncharacterized protein (DUF952 family)